MSTATDTMVRDSAAAAWSATNQRWLSARFAWLRARIERLGAAASDIAPHVEGTALSADEIALPADDAARNGHGGHFAALDHVAGLFDLSAFERSLLLLAAGIELDGALREAVAEAQGRPASGPLQVPFSLALAVLPDAHWDAISPMAPLRRWLLIQVDATAGWLQAGLRIDERLLHHLTGVAAFDARLDGLARVIEPDAAGPADLQTVGRAAAALRAQPSPLVMLAGVQHGVGRRHALHALARADLCAIWADVSVWPHDASEFAKCARHLDREAALIDAGIVVPLDCPGAVDGELSATRVPRLIDALSSPVVLIGELAPAQCDRRARRAVRIDATPRRVARPPAAAARALEQFRVDARTLDEARASLADPDDADAVWDALREAARGGLDGLAQRIDSGTRFDDLVLPPATLAQLHEITSQLRHRHLVHDEWGFGSRDARGLGICALFTGESGTGKTLAAEAIANALRLDLYRVDLSVVVSKYIGETERNLKRVFDAAEASGAVLLFDEADALFGKRSEVKDSHDRYANIEVAYLLQRIETYRGLAVLTTNLKGALDRAFLRRIRFVVQFPFPDQAAREQIWRQQFPRQAPVRELDFAALARIQLTGGNIRSIAINAAHRAADGTGVIEQRTVIDAARAECAKLERGFSERAVGGTA